MTYTLDNAHDATATRFRVLEALYDPVTVGQLDAVGVTRRWRCWEVGAGSGSIAAAMAERGADVVATDIDLSRIAPMPRGVRVLRHDVAHDPLPSMTGFDLIHLRLVASHLRDWPTVLPRLVGALDRGGWLIVEDLDPMHDYQPAPVTDVDRLVNRVGHAFTGALASFGGDPTLGRKLRRQLVDVGMVDTASAGMIVEACGGEAAADLMIANVTQTAPLLREHGIDDDDLAAYTAAMHSPATRFIMPTFWTASGRRR